jgi:hypothetical protein
MDELSSTAAVIEALGGNQRVAALTDSTNKAVSNWRGFETFPSNTFVAMTEALRARGKTAPAALWGMKVPAEASQ